MVTITVITTVILVVLTLPTTAEDTPTRTTHTLTPSVLDTRTDQEYQDPFTRGDDVRQNVTTFLYW